jgi:integrase/recombinase XerD
MKSAMVNAEPEVIMNMDLHLSQALESFMLSCRSERKSPKTIQGYRDVLNRFINLTTDIPADQLTPDHIRGYIVSLVNLPGKVAGRQFSSSSMLKHYQVIRTWVRWMYAQQMIPTCPTDKTKAPVLGDPLPSTLTDDEVKALFRHIKEEQGRIARFRDQVIFMLFLDTGMRLNEVACLTVGDLNIEEGLIHIKNGKGAKEGSVPMGNYLARDLYTYLHRHRQAALGETALFIGKSGFALGYEGLAVMVRRTISAVRVGEGKRGAHVLRHTMATNFLRAGGSVETLRKILRHNDIRITQIYLHLTTEDIITEHRKVAPLDFVYRQH